VIQFRKDTDIAYLAHRLRGPCRTATAPVAYRGLIYCSSVSGPVPGLGSRSDEMGVAVRIVSCSVTTTTPGTGFAITSMIVSSDRHSSASCVLKAEGEIDLSAPRRVPARLRGDAAAVAEAAAVLAQAKRPLVIAGDAVAQGCP
jgi:hypothetical protein